MPAILALLAISLLLAGVAIYQSRRHHGRSPAPSKLHAVNSQPSIRRVGSLVREGHIGDGELGVPVRTLARIAPPEQPAKALEVLNPDGSTHTSLKAGQVVMARAWSKGHLVVAFGETRREYGPAWALGPGMAGWEIHLVDSTGGIVRCYGGPGTQVDDDLDRLRTRLQAVVLAHAS